MQLLQHEVLGNLSDTLKCAIPAIAFTVQVGAHGVESRPTRSVLTKREA